jgi:hypothetical protein
MPFVKFVQFVAVFKDSTRRKGFPKPDDRLPGQLDRRLSRCDIFGRLGGECRLYYNV